MYLVFDIGGTKMRLASSVDGKTLSETIIISTPANFEEGLSELEKTAQQLIGNQELTAVAGGIPGILDDKQSTPIRLTNLPSWVDQPLKTKLQNTFHAPVFLENDAALAALGEAIYGAGQGKKIVAYLTISSGVGGARVVKGEIDQRSIGFEPGNQIINLNPVQTLEEIISGKALEEKYHQKPEEITEQEVWVEVAKDLAIGLNNIIVLWSPEVIVLGGGEMKSIDLEKVKENLRGLLKIFPQIPEVTLSRLGDRAGFLGALEYLREKSS